MRSKKAEGEQVRSSDIIGAVQFEVCFPELISQRTANINKAATVSPKIPKDNDSHYIELVKLKYSRKEPMIREVSRLSSFVSSFPVAV